MNNFNFKLYTKKKKSGILKAQRGKLLRIAEEVISIKNFSIISFVMLIIFIVYYRFY